MAPSDALMVPARHGKHWTAASAADAVPRSHGRHVEMLAAKLLLE